MANYNKLYIFTMIVIVSTASIRATILKQILLSALNSEADRKLNTIENDLDMEAVETPTESTKLHSGLSFDTDEPLEAERYTERVLWADSSELDDSMINKQKFKYLVNNEDICSDDVFVLALIKSTPERFIERRDIRDTWGSVREYKGVKVVPVFTMGKFPPSNSTDIERELLKENVKYGDIIQGDFVEHYRNQTYKTIMGLKWARDYCRQARFILNTNDDTMVDTFHLVNFLQSLVKEKKSNNILYCSTFYDQGPDRNPNNKNYITIYEYPYDKFPPHCEGFGYIMSRDVSENLLHAAKSVPFLWLDDVFTTGFLVLKSDIKHFDMLDEHSYQFMQKSQIDAGIENSIFLVAKYRRLRDNWDAAWKAIESKRKLK